VLVTHDVPGGLAEADLALGLRGGQAAFCRPARDVGDDAVRGLFA
jgi:hypothetical protein